MSLKFENNKKTKKAETKKKSKKQIIKQNKHDALMITQEPKTKTKIKRSEY